MTTSYANPNPLIEKLDDLIRLEALVERTCTCGRGSDKAAHEAPCPFAAHTAHLPAVPDEYRPQAYRDGAPAPDVWADGDELDCNHEPRRLHDCPRCRSAVL